MGTKEGGLPVVHMKTEKGELEMELFEKDAPKTVANFVELVSKGYYDGIRFHRVLDAFVVQGGCPHSKTKGDPKAGTGGPGHQTECELSNRERKHEEGALSMAHAGTCKHDAFGRKKQGNCSNGSQFFIVLDKRNCNHLNGVHTVFGHVTKGFDVVKKIKPWDQIVSAKVGA